MPTWLLITFWVVVAAVAVAAYVEHRRGHRYTPVEPSMNRERAEFEDRARIRGQEGHGGGL